MSELLSMASRLSPSRERELGRTSRTPIFCKSRACRAPARLVWASEYGFGLRVELNLRRVACVARPGHRTISSSANLQREECPKVPCRTICSKSFELAAMGFCFIANRSAYFPSPKLSYERDPSSLLFWQSGFCEFRNSRARPIGQFSAMVVFGTPSSCIIRYSTE